VISVVVAIVVAVVYVVSIVAIGAVFTLLGFHEGFEHGLYGIHGYCII